MSLSRPARVLARAGTVTAVLAGLAVVAATPALAHVTAQPGAAEKGGYTVVALRVPTESDTAGTVALQVTLPAEHPISSVRTTPRPGWSASVERVPLDPPVTVGERTLTESVRSVTWTADPGVRIGPGEFADFPLSLGPLPTDTDVLVLPAVQTYDDGEVVAWDQPPVDGAEPERPAPTVTLTGDTMTAGHGHGDGGTAAEPAGATTTTAASTTSTGDPTARWLGGGGLLLGALGLGLGAGSMLRNRRGEAR